MEDHAIDFSEEIKGYKDKLRIFLILYIFSEELDQPNSFRRIFKSEVKIQKIDFLLRNPDYFAYEVMLFAKENKINEIDCKNLINTIFDSNEPIIRRIEMERFFFGAYENIDDVISFLKSIGFIDFKSKKSLDLKTIDKQYFITDLAVEKFQEVNHLSSFNWYVSRLELIKQYFGDLSGSQLKVMQYQIDEYRNTSYKDYISDIQDTVRRTYFEMFGEELYEI
ncbi:hypothetical protein [Bacillus sp. UNCCL81]|uniref:hypothetical protein n=1 Tax=Bacillus sp. UNCCL81 TaxID=1502755 RepID=UPI0003FDE5A1|nr:hypothetical protein [Bacillus sp. UNCCL81]SFD60945.1 hypothetical protein SAMN02799633_04270 [Bacillus sp. UNCCL81]